MLTIRSFQDGSLFIALRKLYMGISVIRLGVILPPDNNFTTSRLGLAPVDDGPCSDQGDRACNHDNFHGELLYFPPGMVKQEDIVLNSTNVAPIYHYSTTKFVYDRSRPTSYTSSCTTWMTPGVDGSVPEVDTIYLDPIYGVNHKHNVMNLHWYWKGSSLFVEWKMHEYCSQPGQVIDDYTVAWSAYNFDTCYYSSDKVYNILTGDVRITQTGSWPINPTGLPVSSVTVYGQKKVGWGSALDVPKCNLEDASALLNKTFPLIDPNTFGDLCAESISDAHAIDINSIAYLKEALFMKTMFKDLFLLLNGKVTVKSLSKLFLSFKYGLRLSCIDTKEIAMAAKTALEDHAHYRFRYVRAMANNSQYFTKGPLRGLNLESQYNYKVYYDPLDDKILNLYRILCDLDLFPSLQNVWDLIPFSFVVDWFIKFEDAFDAIDTRNYVKSLRINGVIKTSKRVVNRIPASVLQKYLLTGGLGTLSGSFSYTQYHRVLQNVLDLPQVRLNYPEKFRNIAELTAIIITLL